MDLAPGTVIADRYVVDGRLGKGGMAVVYRVHQRALGTPYALKVVATTSTSAAARLEDEGRHQATLRHPNVVAVHDLVRVAGAPALVLELVEGPSLASLIGGAPLLVDAIDRLGAGILAGVAAAHRAGLVHRDLKPGNVLLAVVDGQVVPKVSDFGIARQLDADPEHRRTATGASLGTPHYMAPEQVRDSKDVDARADVWALGVLLYELAAGRPPFDSPDRLELFQAIAKGEAPPLDERRPDLPPRMLRAIAAALQVDRERRPADAAALLERWLDGRTEVGDTTSLTARVQAAVPTVDRTSSGGSATTWADETAVAPRPPPAVAARPSWLPLVLAVVVLAALVMAWQWSRPLSAPPPPIPDTPAGRLFGTLLDADFAGAADQAQYLVAGSDDSVVERTLAVGAWVIGRRYTALEELDKGTRSAVDADAAVAMQQGLVDPDALDRWIEGHPDDLLARAWRVLIAPGWRPEVVARHVEAAERLAPGRALPAFLAARAERAAGRHGAAAAALERATKLSGGRPELTFEQAASSGAQGRWHEASSILESFEPEPWRTEVWLLRVMADTATGAHERLQRDVAAGARLTIEPKVRFHLAHADALLAAGRVDEALAQLDAAQVACDSWKDDLVRWFCGGLRAEAARVAFVAGDDVRARASAGALVLSGRLPPWAQPVVPWRAAVAEGLVAVLEGDRDRAGELLRQLRGQHAAEWTLAPLAEALEGRTPGPPRVRPDLLP